MTSRSSSPQRSRHLDWAGCFNARDLGGLPIAGGGHTRRRALVRSDSLEGLTASDWAAAWDHGVRTVINLRNDDERGPDTAVRPSGITTIQLPLDGVEDREFWEVWDSGPQFGTPLYYRPHLERFPERNAAVIGAIAAAGPGTVLFHCGGGRDRAGQIAMVLLHLVGVAPEHIAADYALSAQRLSVAYAARGEEDQEPALQCYLAECSTTAADVIADTLVALDIESLLRAGGLTDANLTAVRTRLQPG